MPRRVVLLRRHQSDFLLFFSLNRLITVSPDPRRVNHAEAGGPAPGTWLGPSCDSLHEQSPFILHPSFPSLPILLVISLAFRDSVPTRSSETIHRGSFGPRTSGHSHQSLQAAHIWSTNSLSLRLYSITASKQCMLMSLLLRLL